MEITEEIESAVQRAARSAAYDWHNIMEYDDIHQDLWMFMLSRPSVQDKTGEELDKVLRWQANSLCKQAQVDYEYFSGNFQYSPRDVREGAKSMTEFDGTPDEQADYDLAVEILWQYRPEKFEDLESWFDDPDSWNTRLSGVRSRVQRMFDALTDAMNEVRRARLGDRKEGPGTKPRDSKPPVPVNDWEIYKQGAITNG